MNMLGPWGYMNMLGPWALGVYEHVGSLGVYEHVGITMLTLVAMEMGVTTPILQHTPVHPSIL